MTNLETLREHVALNYTTDAREEIAWAVTELERLQSELDAALATAADRNRERLKADATSQEFRRFFDFVGVTADFSKDESHEQMRERLTKIYERWMQWPYNQTPVEPPADLQYMWECDRCKTDNPITAANCTCCQAPGPVTQVKSRGERG